MTVRRPAARCYAAPSGKGRCNNTTTHPSNRCHLHRQELVGATATATDAVRDAAAMVASADPFAAQNHPVDFTEDGIGWAIGADYNHRPYLVGSAPGWHAQVTQAGSANGPWVATVYEDLGEDVAGAKYPAGRHDTAEQARAAAANRLALATGPEYDAPDSAPFANLPARWGPSGEDPVDMWDVTVSDDGQSVEMRRTVNDEWVDPGSDVGIPALRSDSLEVTLGGENGDTLEVEVRTGMYVSGDLIGDEETHYGQLPHTGTRSTLDRLADFHIDDLD